MKQRVFNRLWFTLLYAVLALSTVSCGGGGGGGKETPATPTPTLSVGATSLTLAGVVGGADPSDTTTLVISNTGQSGSTLNWTAIATTTSGGSWLSVSPTSGSLTSGQSDTITVNTSILGLAAGNYSGTVTISDGTTTTDVSVLLSIGTFGANPTSLTFTTTQGSNPQPQLLTIVNSSSSTLTWAAADDATWLSLSNASGSLTTGNTVAPSVTVNAAGLAAGVHSGTITITPSNGAPVTVSVALTVSAPQVAKSGTVTISGSAGATQLSSLVARVGKAAEAPKPQDKLANAKVTIVVIKPNGNTSTTTTFTDDKGNYSLDIDVSEGDTVTVTIEKDGYTTFSKTVKVELSERYNVNGSLAAANVIVAKKGEALTKSGVMKPGFQFGLMRDRSGRLTAFKSGFELRVAKASGSTPDLVITIPADKVDPQVSALTARLASFNPADANDRSMFPGEFKGTGGYVASAATDTGEYQLESVVFMQAKVTQDNGKDLTLVSATGATKANEDPVTITKWIPTEGCEAIKKYTDRDADKEGIQVPIYTYNAYKGKWGYVGEGTLKYYDYSSGSYVTVSETDPSSLACSTFSYYVEIIVDKEWTDYWNLDYPLLFSEPQTVCVSGQVLDGDDFPVAGTYVYASGRSYAYAYTDENGYFKLEIVLGEEDSLSDYHFYVYNNMTYQYEEFLLGEKTETCYTPKIKITDPWQCKVEGKVKDKDLNKALPDAGVYAYATDGTYWNWDNTDQSGNYRFKTICGSDIVISARNQTRTVNVNNTKDATNEKSDSGKNVVATDIEIENQPPDVWLYVWPYSAMAGDTIYLYAYAWDPDGDSIESYSWKINNSAYGDNIYYQTWIPDAAGTYTIEVTVTDSKDKSTTKTETVTIEPKGNRAPILWSYWYSRGACGNNITFYANAYDQDGDSLSFTWKDADGNTIATRLDGDGNGSEEYQWNTPVDGNVTLEVSDGNGGSAAATFYVEAGNNPPVIYYAYAWPWDVRMGDEVTFYGWAWDPDGDPVTYEWSVDDVAIAGNTSTFTATGTYKVGLKASDGVCGGEATTEFYLTVAEKSDTEVIIQKR